jgi:hypothetical protein
MLRNDALSLQALHGPVLFTIIPYTSPGLLPMLDDAWLLLSAVRPTILLIGLLLTSLVVAWRAGRARPGTRRPQLHRRRATAVEPPELPRWRGVRH